MIKLKYLNSSELNPALDNESIEKICVALNKKYVSFLEQEVIEIETGFDKYQAQVKMILKKIDGSLVYPIEAIHVLDPEGKSTAATAIDVMVDYLDAYWNEYFTENRDVYVSLDWTMHTCESVNFYLRGFVRNQELESAADALLREHGYGNYNIEPISSET